MLRGWKGLPCGIVVRKTGGAVFVDAKTYSIFTLLDGCHDIDESALSPEHKSAWSRLVKQQALDFSKEPFPSGLPSLFADYKEYPCRTVTAVQWSITGGCNLKCRHCYISAPHYKYRDLDTAECLRIVDQLAEAGVAAVTLTGGEPLIRKDFWTIVDGILAKGISFDALMTNGILADDAFLDEFEKRGLSSRTTIVVSFDGVRRHDWLRGVPGCEEQTIAALKRIIARGHRVTVNTVLHTGSLDALVPTYELMVSLGVDYWQCGGMTDAGEWAASSVEPGAPKTAPRQEMWSRYYDLAKRYLADGNPIAIQLGGCFRGARVTPESKPIVLPAQNAPDYLLDSYACGACRFQPSIMPDGRLLPCTGMTGLDLEMEMPDLLKTSLAEVYSGMDKPFFALANIKVRDVLAANERCRDCEWRLKCRGGCRLHSILQGHGPAGWEEANCEFFQNGWANKFMALTRDQ